MSRWPKYELIQDLPTKSPNTKLGDAGSIYFTSYCIHKLIHCVDLSNLKSISMWPKYDVMWDLPRKSTNTKLGDAGSITWQVIMFIYKPIHVHCVDLSNLESTCRSRWTHPRPSHKEPKYQIRWCWVHYFTSYHVHKVKVNKSIQGIYLSNLESRSRWPNYKFIRDLPMKSSNTELGDAGSIMSQGITFTSWYTVLTPKTLKLGQGDPNTNSFKIFQ